MRKTFRYRLYPTRKQETLLNRQLEECRWLYNHFLEHRKHSWEWYGVSQSLYNQIGALPSLKKEKPSLDDQDLYCSQVFHREMVGDSFLRKCPGTGSSRKIPPGRNQCRGENLCDTFGWCGHRKPEVFPKVCEKAGSGSEKTGTSTDRIS